MSQPRASRLRSGLLLLAGLVAGFVCAVVETHLSKLIWAIETWHQHWLAVLVYRWIDMSNAAVYLLLCLAAILIGIVLRSSERSWGFFAIMASAMIIGFMVQRVLLCVPWFGVLLWLQVLGGFFAFYPNPPLWVQPSIWELVIAGALTCCALGLHLIHPRHPVLAAVALMAAAVAVAVLTHAIEMLPLLSAVFVAVPQVATCIATLVVIRFLIKEAQARSNQQSLKA